MLSWCGRKKSDTRKCARCDGRDFMVSSVVLNVCVHVSSVTIVFAGSIAIAGGSESRIAEKGGGWLNAATCAGSGGTVGASSRVDIVFTLSEERRDGERGISAGAGGGGLLGRGGDLRPGLSGSASVSSSSKSSAGSGGSGGKGGLVGVGGESTGPAVSTEEWCEMRFSFFPACLAFIVAPASGARRTPVSRSASSGVRTTVAPAPNVPPRGEPTSIVRARLGSEGRMGREGAGAGAEAGGELVRDSQCIVLDIEGRRGLEEAGGVLMRDWLCVRA